jgi:nicotinamide phosphoribosyltransferase
MTTNLLLNTDSYKASHWLQYPAETQVVHSYIESRGGKYEKTVFFGLQMFLKEYLTKLFSFKDIEEAAAFWETHGEPFNKEGWIALSKKHNCKLPVRIRAVPEGTVVPYGHALVTIENTDPEFYWLPSYLETALLRAVWYPTTVASNSYYSKQIILKYLEETGDPSLIDFKLHDFGARGVSSLESAGIGGAAHLVNFMGTDTVAGALYAMKYYNTKEMVAFSIPAAEHSTITSWGKENEVEAYRNMLTQFAKPGSLVAVVSDSYDIYNAVEKLWGGELKQEVIDSGATVVIRPDSGEPASVVTKVAHLLDKTFGSVTNSKGYKVLNNVRIIQGDGIDHENIHSILFSMQVAGFSADNIAFGQGGALLQQVNRDTNKFAMKCSAIRIGEDKWIDVFKDPVTDSGKRSKKGRLTLLRSNMTGEYMTVPVADKYDSEWEEVLETVYENGKITKQYTFAEVRANANKGRK